MGELEGRHGRIADEDHLVVVRIGVEQLPRVDAFGIAAAVVLPHALIDAVVEVEIFEVLELGARRREQFLADADMRVHGAADVEEDQHLHGVAPLRHQLHVEPALARGGADGVGQVEFLGRALARELAQPPERHLDVAGAEFHRVVEIPELALVPHLDGGVVAVPVLSDAHAGGIVAMGAEGRGAGSADPFRAALVAALLLLEALLQLLQNLLEAAQRLHQLLLVLGEVLLGELPQPLLWNLGEQSISRTGEALEDMPEDTVEAIEVALVLHQGGAREVVEFLCRILREVVLQRLDEGEVFLERDGHARGLEFGEEGEEHQPPRACSTG